MRRVRRQDEKVNGMLYAVRNFHLCGHVELEEEHGMHEQQLASTSNYLNDMLK
jgi:hypothetical protein